MQLHFYHPMKVLSYYETQSYLYVCKIPVVLQKQDGLLLILLLFKAKQCGAAGEDKCLRRGKTAS